MEFHIHIHNHIIIWFIHSHLCMKRWITLWQNWGRQHHRRYQHLHHCIHSFRLWVSIITSLWFKSNCVFFTIFPLTWVISSSFYYSQLLLVIDIKEMEKRILLTEKTLFFIIIICMNVFIHWVIELHCVAV